MLRSFLLIVLFFFASNFIHAQKVDVVDAVLSVDSVFSICRPSGMRLISRSGECAEEQARVSVATVTSGGNMDGLRYYYVASDGVITGDGSTVVWDLSNARAGTHTITVGIGKDDVVIGATVTRSVKVLECECNPPCVCPTIVVTGPAASVRVGNRFIVSAKVAGSGTTYRWTVSDGHVLEGQSAARALIQAPSNANPVRVTLTIGGTDPSCDCPTTESIEIPISE